jgi:alpha-D-xyloside xylohydrolase
MPEAEWALLPRTDGPTPVGIRILEQSATVENGDISAEITAAGKLSLYRKDGRLLLEEFVRNRKSFSIGTGEKTLQGFASALDIDAREFKPILSGDYALTLRFESDPAERLYGMGQYQQPYLNLKGCMLELAQRNSQASVPFVVSSLGYGFLWNNPGIGRVTFGRNVTTWEASSTKVMDYWVTAGENPAAILSSYARATGSVPMMPDWAMGFWQCKLRYQTQEELLQVAREYKRRGLPISVIVIDFFHWPMQGEWKFDPEYWPDPDAMIAELNGLGIELMVSVWPTVDHRSENYPEMVEKGYLISTDRGHRIAMDFHGNTVHFDATNPGARAYVWQKCKANYYDKGIRLFWLDEAEPEYTSYDFDLYRYHLGPDVQVGNIYPALYARAFYEGMEAAGQEKIINLIRCAWAGSQRYGALVWSGDIHSSFESMRNQFAAGLNMGMAGIPWWTTDIGGFHGGNINDPAFGELLVRWFQYGAFCPVMRLHGVREPQTPPLGNSGGGVCNSGAANEVWSYGPEVYEILKGYLFMRERLRPYISGLMKEAHQNGSPVIRPLFYEFPEDEDAWRCEDAFMFGPDLLVAPVMYAGARSREVYLPAESRWTNAWTNEVLSGGQTVTVAAPLSQIPLFLRNDVKLPIQEGG